MRESELERQLLRLDVRGPSEGLRGISHYPWVSELTVGAHTTNLNVYLSTWWKLHRYIGSNFDLVEQSLIG